MDETANPQGSESPASDNIAKSDAQTQSFRERAQKEQMLAVERRRLKEEDLK